MFGISDDIRDRYEEQLKQTRIRFGAGGAVVGLLIGLATTLVVGRLW